MPYRKSNQFCDTMDQSKLANVAKKNPLNATKVRLV
jgi:hypothetical protein